MVSAADQVVLNETFTNSRLVNISAGDFSMILNVTLLQSTDQRSIVVEVQ